MRRFGPIAGSMESCGWLAPQHFAPGFEAVASSYGTVDLQSKLKILSDDWRARQSEMENWYRAFVLRADASKDLFEEHRPYISKLEGLRGRVLDVGGGTGFVRQFLARDTQYFVIDPSGYWQEANWENFATQFPALTKPLLFVQGVGETLPFPPACFDVVLSFWSLNHVVDSAACILEMHRVLKSRGRAILVLEDMEPRWRDVARMCWRDLCYKFGRHVAYSIDWNQEGIRSGKKTVLYKLSGLPWPLQSDHKRIEEGQLRALYRDRFRIMSRSWDGGFLHFELEKLE
jgi:SAM-dependent methyltransferase